MSTETKKPATLREGVRAKFIEMWAKRYVELLTKLGKDKAYDWGNRFFHKEDIPFIAARAKEILKGRGVG